VNETETVQDILDDEELKDEFSDLPSECGTITHVEANRILERRAEICRQMDLINEQEADEMKRIEVRAAELREAYCRKLAWLTLQYQPMLEEFARAETDGKKERSVRLLSGTVGFRRNPSSVEITDADALLAWAKENAPNAVKVVESVGKTPIKAHIEGTGEVVPGVEYTPPADRFYIKEG
jgi:phage host-nuclease inhibitor protein Gam